MFKFLVIENDEVILNFFKWASTVSDHNAETASDQKEGIQKFNDGNFDVVITDINMPKFNGPDMIEHVRNSESPSTVVIAMSGMPWRHQNTGFDVVLSKPFPIQDLVESIPFLVR